MLEDVELRDVKQAFWKRYRLRFPAEVHPADSLLSRVSRELSKRMLCVFAIWKVRSLYFQLTAVQRKRKLGDNLYTEEIETEESVSKDVETYSDKLYTLLLAYAMAGVHPLPGLDPCKESVLSASSVEFVAPVSSAAVAAGQGHRGAQRVGHPLREGTPLHAGHNQDLIKQVMEARDAHWLVTGTSASGSLGDAQATGETGTTASQAAPQVSHFGEGPKVSGKRVAAVLKDGTKLCPDFQLRKWGPQCREKGK